MWQTGKGKDLRKGRGQILKGPLCLPTALCIYPLDQCFLGHGSVQPGTESPPVLNSNADSWVPP